MENKIKTLISELKQENEIRAKKMNEETTDYNHTVLVHTYNLTINFINRLEKLL